MENVDSTIVHMRLLSEQIDETYQSMKNERKALSQWEENKAFSILGVLELFSTDIQGYVESLSVNQLESDRGEILIHLRRLNAFQIDDFTAWYFESCQTYPQTRLYVEQLDHLRLLLIEHFSARVPVAA